ncbi:MAG: hypothetical protein ACYS8W_12805 [Planctomycetota bacterium]|jgi:hypothetical protein
MKTQKLVMLVLLGLCACMFAGCVVWDSGNRELNKYFKNFQQEDQEFKPIANGDSLESVVARLGMPTDTVAHGGLLLATWRYSRGGHLLMGLVGGSDVKNLFIIFDKDGKVLGVKDPKGEGGSFSFLWPFTEINVPVK